MSHPFTIRRLDGWYEVTDDIEALDKPWTLAKSDGVGAFQFSVATYKDGFTPNPSPQILLSMLREFVASCGLRDQTEVVTEDEHLQIAAASFRGGEEFIRVWYVSNGGSLAKVTYTCACGMQHRELPDCERMIRTLRFANEKC